MTEHRPLIVFILGPTGTGKSEFAVKLAKRINGEIISCDSMQVYKEMPILSQQPKAKLRNAVPHHLIGVLSPSREWSAAAFIEKASETAEDIVGRNRVPIVAGGTGLYARALMKGLFPSPPKDEKLRKKFREEAARRGNKKLYERLLKTDPVYASKIHPNDLRRIIRALEVYKLTGRPISEQHKGSEGIEKRYEVLVFILNRPRRELYRRINERVEGMFGSGLLREAKRLKKKGMSRTAKAVLGYKEVDGYINGDYGLEEAKELLKKNTRHYAKRQLTWFRKEKDAAWLEAGSKKPDAVLLNMVVKKIHKT